MRQMELNGSWQTNNNAFTGGNGDVYFQDGTSKIDMILAYDDTLDFEISSRGKVDARATFESNLEASGLKLEREPSEDSFDKKTAFVKVHAPENVLEENAEVFGIQPPVKQFLVTFYSTGENLREKLKVTWWTSFIRSKFNCDQIPPEPSIFFPGFFPDRTDKYVVKERRETLTNAQRSQIVWNILSRAGYDRSRKEKVGIQRLINKKVYKAAFPLHDGEYDYHNPEENISKMNERRLLYLEWANLKKWYKKQPLWLIKNYFGVKIGLYFAWLGFYTQLLIIPAVVGLFCFIYGCVTITTSTNQASTEICDEMGVGNLTMCPVCDRFCDYWKLSDSCFLSKVTYLFDNSSTVFFSLFMSFWATTYIELWKRRQAILQWEWDLDTYGDAEEMRPEYEIEVKTSRFNPVTQKKEAYLTAREKTYRITLTSGVVILMLCLVLGAVFSVILFRIMIITFMYQSTDESSEEFFKTYARLLATSLAAAINSIVIEAGGLVFQVIAKKITKMEFPRTQTEFENSYTFKMFLFQFINYYSSLIYTAFFKGRFFTHPGDKRSRNDWVSKLKLDVCDPAGCLYELCIMLAIYMVLRQMFSNFLELFVPKFNNWFRGIRVYLNKVHHFEAVHLKQWEKDYQLEEIERLHLFNEYIEMIIQYGFVTLFVAAFPLAPLLALINNVFEIRLDAYKYTTQMRRPLASQVRDIGIWYNILEGMTYLSVGFNAFVIGLTSDFIPKAVYQYVYSKDYSLVGYVNFTLSVFRVADWGDRKNPDENYYGPLVTEYPNATTCAFRAFRADAGQPDEYAFDKTWLHVFAARLGFIVIFEQLVFVLKGILAYAIPDTPNNLQTQLGRERLLLQDNLYEAKHRHLPPDLKASISLISKRRSTCHNIDKEEPTSLDRQPINEPSTTPDIIDVMLDSPWVSDASTKFSPPHSANLSSLNRSFNSIPNKPDSGLERSYHSVLQYQQRRFNPDEET